MRISRHKRYSRKPAPVAPGSQFKANEAITAPEVSVIDEAGQFLGAMPIAEALALAQEKELDLVEVNPTTVPPITKILDYGAFKYQKEKEARKQKAKQTDTKGIRLTARIGDHDLDIRVKQAVGFLEDGDKVKADLMLRGREKQFADRARSLLMEFQQKVDALIPVKAEGSIEKQENRLTITLIRR